ncbi:MAG: UDP-3-O-(3-hydroxymyristoyl)glucosamine N-acyltransferase [Pseudomonadota bacterium]
MRVADLAVKYGCDIVGDIDCEVTHVATLQNAGVSALSFLSNPAYRKYLQNTKASAVIVAEAFASEVPGCAIVAEDPYVTYARMAADLHPASRPEGGVHPSAIVAESASVDPSATIRANAVIEAGAKVGPGCIVGPCSVLGENSALGENSVLESNVSIMSDVKIGARCVLHSGCVVGADGFGIARAPEGWIKVPQVGGVRIGDDVEIGACTSIDRGAIEHTVIGNGVKLDNQIQIGHNCIIGDHTVMAGMTGIAGSTTIGRNCVFGGNSGTTGHLTIADGVVITARCTVTADIESAGTFGGVFPHEEFRQYQRNLARYRQLDKLARRVAALEKRNR